jgi:thiamine biosynthesis protein ThiS
VRWELNALQIIVNATPREIVQGATVADLLAELRVRPQHCAVERNLEIVPRTRYAKQVLEPGDRIEVVTLVGGG